jgi:hypothetical protein
VKAVPTSSTVDLKFPDESDLRNKSFTLPLVSTGMVKLGISVPFDYPIPLSSLLPATLCLPSPKVVQSPSGLA